MSFYYKSVNNDYNNKISYIKELERDIETY